ncbi:hypothetical protein D9M70_532600 [compost metagenome]
MYLGHHLIRLAHRGDHQRHPVFDHGSEVGVLAIVRAMQDQVDAERRSRAIRMLGIMTRQFLADLCQPRAQLIRRAGVERGESTDDTGLALRGHQFDATG